MVHRTCRLCKTPNIPLAHICEVCWMGHRRLTGTNSVSSSSSSIDTEADLVELEGVGTARATMLCFARPAHPRSQGVRMVVRALWMAEEELARIRAGMSVPPDWKGESIQAGSGRQV